VHKSRTARETRKYHHLKCRSGRRNIFFSF